MVQGSGSSTGLSVGQRLPDFELVGVSGDGAVSSRSLRGKPYFLSPLRGLYCPFCRRRIAQLGRLSGSFRQMGIETLIVIPTQLENARLYFKFHPVTALLAIDPELSIHRALGLPRVELNPENLPGLLATRLNPTGELSEKVNVLQALQDLNAKDGFSQTPTDQSDVGRHQLQTVGQLFVDREGTVRWLNIEVPDGDFNRVGMFPAEAELLAAARLVA